MTTPTLPLAFRDGRPAINVKDRTVWAHDARAEGFIAQLDQNTIKQCYGEAQSKFWNDDVPELAEAHGFAPSTIEAEGRSGGWLTINGTTFGEYVIDSDLTIPPADDTADNDTRAEYADAIAERDRFLAFAESVAQSMDYAGGAFIVNLREACEAANAPSETGTDTYAITTPNGTREWEADSASHAIEQHEDAHLGDPGENVIDVCLKGYSGETVTGWDSIESWSMAHGWTLEDVLDAGVSQDDNGIIHVPADFPPYTPVQTPRLRTAAPDVLEAIANIVDYNWSDEAHDFENCEADGNDPTGHIFHDLRRVRDWLEA